MKHLINLIRDNALLSKNISYLGIIQIANFILPLVAIPHIISKVGLANYGLISLSQAIAFYLNILVEYGFNFSATKDVSVNRDSINKVNKIFTSVIVLKIVFFIITFFLYAAIIYFIPKLKEEFNLFISGYFIVFGLAIFPIWLFQGLEKLKYITIANVIGKLFMVLSIYTLVKKQSDYTFVMYIYSAGYIVIGFLSLFFALKYNVKFVKVSLGDLKSQLFRGYDIFISSLGISLYRNINILIVSYFTSNESVGIYSLSEKLVKSVQTLINPVTQAIFPNASMKINSSTKEIGKEYVEKIVSRLKRVLIAFVILLFISSPLISYIFLREHNTLFFIILFVLSPIIVFGSLNYTYGVIGLINFAKERLFSKAIYIGASFNFITGILGGYYFGATGVASSLLFTEVIIFIMIKRRFTKL